MKGKRFLVTGGTGFIGSALVGALVRAGARVRSLDDDSRGSKRRLGELAGDVELLLGDVRDTAVVRQAVKGVDHVCHLAAVNGTAFFYSAPELVLEVAVKGMVNVIDACLAESVGELTLLSSSEVYQTPPRIPTEESVPLSIPDLMNPRYSYAGGKIVSELLAINYGRKHFERVLIVRPHNVYGPDMGREHVIPEFALRMRRLVLEGAGTIRFPIQGTGRETRAFVYIDDMIDGTLKVIGAGEHLGIYHVGTDEEVTIAGLANEVGRYYGREVEIVPGPLRPGGTEHRCPDFSKLRALGYRPKVSLQEGLQKTLSWYDANAGSDT
jgi:nucleoside-diphosphate-sugar epimerase